MRTHARAPPCRARPAVRHVEGIGRSVDGRLVADSVAQARLEALREAVCAAVAVGAARRTLAATAAVASALFGVARPSPAASAASVSPAARLPSVCGEQARCVGLRFRAAGAHASCPAPPPGGQCRRPPGWGQNERLAPSGLPTTLAAARLSHGVVVAAQLGGSGAVAPPEIGLASASMKPCGRWDSDSTIMASAAAFVAGGVSDWSPSGSDTRAEASAGC